MEVWGYTIDTGLEMLIFSVIVAAVVALYIWLMILIRKYTTGMLGGFILLLVGLGLVLGPAFYLIREDATLAHTVLSAVAIIVGCFSVLIGAFKLTNFGDF